MKSRMIVAGAMAIGILFGKTVLADMARVDLDGQYDDIKISGSELKNPNFDSTTDDWKLTGSENAKAEIIQGQGCANSACIKAWHNGGAIQEIPVKAGQEVFISFWFKKAKTQ